MPESRPSDTSLVESAALDTLRSLVIHALRDHPAAVYLFGSWVTGGRHRASDIDVAIDAGVALPLAVLASLRDALEESPIPYRVDVVDLASVEPAFRERILRTGRVWIERAND